MKYDTTAKTTYNTEISGKDNINCIGENYIVERQPVARPIVTQKGSETFVGRVDELEKLHTLLQGG